jgi:hypothetical protein
MTDQTIPTLSAEELAALAKKHGRCVFPNSGARCDLVETPHCVQGEIWPCDAARAIATAIDRDEMVGSLMDEIARLRLELTELDGDS